MGIKVYNKAGDTVVTEEQYNAGALKFLYNTVVGRFILKGILTRKWVSKVAGFYMNSRASKLRISRFVKAYKINLDEYEIEDYNCFNAFFRRKIKEDARPFSKDSNDLIACADSKVTYYKINEDLSFKLKHSIYTVGEILKDEQLAKEYKNGVCLVLRLCVNDYHRYCFFDNCEIKSAKTIDGILHTVCPVAEKRYKVYSENQREYCVLQTENFGDVIQCEVGAIIVGKIVNHSVNSAVRGQEKGYFEMGGSTIVLLFKENTLKVDSKIKKYSECGIETKVLMGETIGESIMTL